jgi:hypothetical protein
LIRYRFVQSLSEKAQGPPICTREGLGSLTAGVLAAAAAIVLFGRSWCNRAGVERVIEIR